MIYEVQKYNVPKCSRASIDSTLGDRTNIITQASWPSEGLNEITHQIVSRVRHITHVRYSPTLEEEI